MKIQGSPRMNGDIGELEIKLVLSNSEIKWLNSAVRSYVGDEDGEKEIREEIREKILECRNILNPS